MNSEADVYQVRANSLTELALWTRVARQGGKVTFQNGNESVNIYSYFFLNKV